MLLIESIVPFFRFVRYLHKLENKKHFLRIVSNPRQMERVLISLVALFMSKLEELKTMP